MQEQAKAAEEDAAIRTIGPGDDHDTATAGPGSGPLLPNPPGDIWAGTMKKVDVSASKLQVWVE